VPQSHKTALPQGHLRSTLRIQTARQAAVTANGTFPSSVPSALRPKVMPNSCGSIEIGLGRPRPSRKGHIVFAGRTRPIITSALGPERMTELRRAHQSSTSRLGFGADEIADRLMQVSEKVPERARRRDEAMWCRFQSGWIRLRANPQICSTLHVPDPGRHILPATEFLPYESHSWLRIPRWFERLPRWGEPENSGHGLFTNRPSRRRTLFRDCWPTSAPPSQFSTHIDLDRKK
jgi:hypothetical protein